MENHQKYLEHKKIGISKIKYLTNTFGLKSMVFFKAVNFMNQIYLENDISTDDIESIASLCVLLVTEFNECCLPSIYDVYVTNEEKDSFCLTSQSQNPVYNLIIIILKKLKRIKLNINRIFMDYSII